MQSPQVDLESTLLFQQSFFRTLGNQVEHIRRKGEEAHKQITEAQGEQATIKISREFYQKAVDAIYMQSVGELEKLLNAALEFVFFDKRYTVRIELDAGRGAKTLEFIVVDGESDPPMEISLVDGVGQGVRTIFSFVIQTFYILNKGAYPILFIDEAYSFISADYVERFFEFVNGMADTKGLAIVMVTHDTRFLPFARKIYSIANGVVTEAK